MGNICSSVYLQRFQYCLEKSHSHFLNIYLCLQEFGIFFFFADLVAEKVSTSLRTSLCSSRLTSRNPYLNHRANNIQIEVCPSIVPSTAEQSGKLQGEGLMSDRMINGSARGLCQSARLSWHHPSERQRHIHPGTESSLSA